MLSSGSVLGPFELENKEEEEVLEHKEDPATIKQ
jgi:hypothetical protein